MSHAKLRTQNEFPAKVSVEYFPSRIELFKFLEMFLEKHEDASNFEKDYLSEHRDKFIAKEFVRSLNQEKTKNLLYAKIKINLFSEEFNNDSVRFKQINLNANPNPKKRTSLSLPPVLLSKSADTSVLSNNVSSIVSNRGSFMSNLYKQKKKNRNNLSTSTPYMSDFDKRLLENKENKKKWIVKQDFSKYIGQASYNKPIYISNYVSLCPSEPPLNYQFRKIFKEKWVAPNNFIV